MRPQRGLEYVRRVKGAASCSPPVRGQWKRTPGPSDDLRIQASAAPYARRWIAPRKRVAGRGDDEHSVAYESQPPNQQPLGLLYLGPLYRSRGPSMGRITGVPSQ